jgi:hypothetical protein
MQFPGQGVDVLGKMDQLFLDVADLALELRFLPDDLEFQGASLDGHGRQPLGIIVMKFAG